MLVRSKMKLQFGQSMFEVMFAIALSSVILISIVSLAVSSVRNASFSENQSLSSKYIKEAVDWLRAEKDNDWVAFQARAAYSPPGNTWLTWCIQDIPNVGWPANDASCGFSDYIRDTNNLLREVRLKKDAPTDPSLVDSEVIVSWTDSKGDHKNRTNTRFTRWKDSPYEAPTLTPVPPPPPNVVLNNARGATCQSLCISSGFAGGCGGIGTDTGAINGRYYEYQLVAPSCFYGTSMPGCGVSMDARAGSCTEPATAETNQAMWTYCNCIF